MLKILSVQQVRDADKFTIENEPIASIDLMERASQAFCDWYVQKFSPHKKVAILCGMGNNGGDGLAIGRILRQKKYSLKIYTIGDQTKSSDDFRINHQRLSAESVENVKLIDDIPDLSDIDVIIDAMFGSGLTRPLSDLYAEVVELVNSLKATVVSVDIASGLFADKGVGDSNSVVWPDYTVAFEVPKLAFMLAQNHRHVGEWNIVSIGLNEQYIQKQNSAYHLVQLEDITSMLKKKSKFDHKGTNGRGLIFAGSYGKMGAAILAAKGALRSGVGLLTLYVPKCGLEILQTTTPETMSIASGEEYLMEGFDFVDHNAIGIGPGIGTHESTKNALIRILNNVSMPIVLDADALNIINQNSELLSIIPPNSILTPHQKEFDRLVGPCDDDFERLERQREFSQRYGIIIVLKGAHTSITNQDGTVYFNSTGNPGMAKGGSGDILLGMITAFLAQGYDPLEAAIVGVYLHGLAGDCAADLKGMYAMISSDIVENLPKAFDLVVE